MVILKDPDKMADVKELRWSEETISTKELLEKYVQKLPLIIMVTRGYCGQDDIDTICSHQVARIHAVDKQKRVLAKDTRGRYLSIPLDFPIKFEVIDEKKKKPSKAKALSDILNHQSLPLVAQFEKKRKWRFDVGSLRYSSQTFGLLELKKVYVEYFLKGNTIHDGIIDSDIMLLPMYVDVDVKIATGVKNGTEADWKALNNMYSRAVSNIKFNKTNGSKDIMLYPVNNVKNRDPETQSQQHQHRGYRLIPAGSITSTTAPSDGISLTEYQAGSGSLVRLLPNMTLVLNINKDDLEKYASSSRPGSAVRVVSRTPDSMDYQDRKSLTSESSTLSGPEYRMPTVATGNVTRVQLDGPYRPGSSASTSRATAITTPSTLRSHRAQSVGERHVTIDGTSFTLRRAASLESLQDVYPSDADTSSVDFGPYGQLPRHTGIYKKRYGMRLVPNQKRGISRSHHELGMINQSGEEEIEEQYYTEPRSRVRNQSRKNVSFSAADNRIHGVREVFMRPGLQVMVSDPVDNRNSATYVRRPGLERATKLAYRTYTSGKPASVLEYRPSVKESLVRSTNSLNSQPPLTTVTAPAPTSYSTAPLEAFRSLERNKKAGMIWDKPENYENLRSTLSTPSDYPESDMESDVVYQGTLTLKRNEKGDLEADPENQITAQTVAGAPLQASAHSHQIKVTRAAPNFGTQVQRDPETDQLDIHDMQFRRFRTLPNDYTQQNIPIEVDPEYQNRVTEYGEMEGNYKTETYVSMDDGGFTDQSSTMDDGADVVDLTKTAFDMSDNNDGTVIRQDYLQYKQQNNVAESEGYGSNPSADTGEEQEGDIKKSASDGSTSDLEIKPRLSSIPTSHDLPQESKEINNNKISTTEIRHVEMRRHTVANGDISGAVPEKADLQSFRDSIRDLDNFLKTQTDYDSQSQTSSVIGVPPMALTNEVTAL